MDIFLIKDNPTDFESHPEVIGYKRTKEEADKCVEALRLDYRTAVKFYNEVLRPAEEKFRQEHPEPSYPSLTKEPRWPAGLSAKDITAEMKQERANIRTANTKLAKTHSDICVALSKQRIDEVVRPLLATKDPSWVDKWFTVNEVYVMTKWAHLAEGNEYFAEVCEEL